MKRMLLAVLAVILWMGQSQAAGPEASFDDNLVVIISDLHINPEGYQPERCERIIHEILAMRPLPRNVLVLGDIDISVGSIVCLSATMACLAGNAGIPFVGVIAVCVLTGLLCGMVLSSWMMYLIKYRKRWHKDSSDFRSFRRRRGYSCEINRQHAFQL